MQAGADCEKGNKLIGVRCCDRAAGPDEKNLPGEQSQHHHSGDQSDGHHLRALVIESRDARLITQSDQLCQTRKDRVVDGIDEQVQTGSHHTRESVVPEFLQR